MNNLVRDVAYIHYAANKARVQNAMKRLDESTNVLTEEQINQIILEEFNATEILNKIKQIFTNMTNKFVEYTKKQIQNKHDEAYLKAIQPKVAEVAKSKNIPLEMLPYDQGIKNIEGAPNAIFGKFNPEMYNIVKADNKDACIANVQKHLMQGFNPQGDVKFDQFCLNYFQGGNGTTQKANTNVNALDMNGIVTWCLAFPQQLNQINTDINNILGMVGKAVQGVNPAPMANTAPSQTDNTTVKKESTDYSKADIHHKAYQYKSILESVFSEADNPSPAQTAPAANATQGQNPPAEAKPVTGLGQNDKAVDTSGVKIDKQAASQEQKNNQAMGMYMSAIQNVATAILNARLRSTNIIYNDYIKILQTVCPRNEYMPQQQPAQNVQQPAQPAAQGQGNP